MRIRLAATLSILILAAGVQAQQSPQGLTGAWKPQDAARTQALFTVGLSDVTGEGLRILQTRDTLTITRLDSSGALSGGSAIGPYIEPEATYTLNTRESTDAIRRYTGRYGNAVFDGTKLVVETVAPHASWQTAYTIENGQMKTVTVSSARATTVVLYYGKADN